MKKTYQVHKSPPQPLFNYLSFQTRQVKIKNSKVLICPLLKVKKVHLQIKIHFEWLILMRSWAQFDHSGKQQKIEQLLPPVVVSKTDKSIIWREGDLVASSPKAFFPLNFVWINPWKTILNEVQDVNVEHTQIKNVVALSNEHYQGHPRHRVSLCFCFVFSDLCSHVNESRSV